MKLGDLKTNAIYRLGVFTDAKGRVRACTVLSAAKRGPLKGLLKIRFVNRGVSLTGYIRPDEFREL